MKRFPRGIALRCGSSGLLVPSLKCVAWNARLVVVGFAAGSIEKVSHEQLSQSLYLDE